VVDAVTGVVLADLDASGLSESVRLAIAPSAAFLADVEGDGRDELIAHDDDSIVIVAAGPDGFPFDASTEPAAAQFGALEAVDGGDVDGDGNLDLLVGITTTADAVFGLLWGDGSGIYPASAIEPVVRAQSARQLALADLDADGLADLVMSDEQSATISLVRSAGGRVLEPFREIFLDRPAARFVLADLDADGIPDLVITTPGLPPFSLDEVEVRLGSGAYAISSITQITSTGIRSVSVGDIDGDLLPDLLVQAPLPTVTGGAEVVQVLRGLGNGQFGERTEFSCGLTSTGSPFAVGALVSDVDSDGLEDLVCVGERGLRPRRNLSR
jgi:hypothetical protein